MNTTLSSLVEALGWALVHCLWQGTALALALAVLLRTLKNATATLRYGVATITLGILVAAFGVTVLLCWPARPLVPVHPIAASVNAKPSLPEFAPAASAVSVPVDAAAPSAPPPSSAIARIVPAATVIAPETPASISWSERFRARLPWAVAFWAAGVLFFSVRFLMVWLRVKHWVGRAIPVVDRDWKARFAELSTALKISRPVRFLVSAALTAPAVVGWLKPVVLVPAGIFSGLTAAQLEAILAHELAHIRRHDYLVNLLQNLVETLFFYHPAAWWISRQIRHEREHCCDDLAARMCGDALSYAKALTALEEMRGAPPALALAASGGSLLDRIRRLLGVKEQKSAAWPLGILMIGVAALLLSFTIAKAARPEDSPPKAVEVTDGNYRSYCVYQNNDLQFVFLSRHEFTVKKGAAPAIGELIFTKGQKAKEHHLQFAPLEKEENFLRVSQPSGNLHFHYDLTRSRVFHVDFDLHGFSPILRQVPVKLEPITSPELLTRESTKVAEWLAAADPKLLWEYTREKVPDKNYTTGKPVAEANPAILWGEPNDVGLRLGVGGLAQKAEIPVGQDLPIKQYIRNDGRETLRLSATGSFNEGIEAELNNAAGGKTAMKNGYRSQMFSIRAQLAPGEFVELHSSPLQTILANKDGSPSTAPRPYASSFTVSPGAYTLRLSHRIGLFAGLPINAAAGDPRLAPGLGEWTGVLNATPIAIQILAPSVATGKPGTAVEFGKAHRIQFQKRQLVLSHPAPGLTHTGTWAVDAKGNWPMPGGTWRIADPAGDYVAAWDEGGSRLWYVDGTGIQRLDIGEKFTDAGYWAMEEATGDLANMPDGVRTALGLPAKKAATAIPDAAAPVVRGLSLKDTPSTTDHSSLPDLYEANPSKPGQFQQKANVFDMPLSGEKDAPVLKVPKTRQIFYLEFMGRTYGPFTGDAAVELGLTQLVRQKLAQVPNHEGLALLEKMIRKGSEPIRVCACRLVAELPEPKSAFDYDGIFDAVIAYSCEEPPTMTTESSQGMQHVSMLVWAAHGQWEKRRVELPESAYSPGEKIPADHPAIVWSEPDPAGMRLGLSGLKDGLSAKIGQSVPVEIILRNDGPAPVKLSCATRPNGCLRTWLVDETGKKHEGGYQFSTGFIRFRHSRLEPGQSVKVLAGEIDFLNSTAEIATAAHKKGFEDSPRIGAPPGRYTLHLDYRVGSAEYAGLSTSKAGPEKVEWTGLLEMKPLPLTVTAP
jgi:beta-lactamase regulating signal transducer with metallopeptidase domain